MLRDMANETTVLCAACYHTARVAYHQNLSFEKGGSVVQQASIKHSRTAVVLQL